MHLKTYDHPKPDNSDNNNEASVIIEAIPGCKQYLETSGSEIILTLPVDPHLPNIVYIKTLEDKAIPSDATVSMIKLTNNAHSQLTLLFKSRYPRHTVMNIHPILSWWTRQILTLRPQWAASCSPTRRC